jgi:hypothetical protein
MSGEPERSAIAEVQSSRLNYKKVTATSTFRDEEGEQIFLLPSTSYALSAKFSKFIVEDAR